MTYFPASKTPSIQPTHALENIHGITTMYAPHTVQTMMAMDVKELMTFLSKI